MVAGKAPTPASRPDRAAQIERLLPWVLIVVGFFAYLNTLPNEFVFDDEPNILGSEAIRDFGNWRDMLRSPRPMVDFSLALNYRLDSALRQAHPDDRYKLGYDPRGYHVLNMAVHILAALTLFGLVRRTLLLPQFRERMGACAAWLAFVTAILWLVHPLNTQAVTYVIQRGESMMGLFFLLTLYASLRHAQSRGAARFAWLVCAVAACAAGMGSKQVMVGAPLVVLLYDWTFFGGRERGIFRRRAALYAGLFATWAVLGAVTGSAIIGKDASAGFAMPIMSWWRYAISQPLIILHYLRLSFVPYPLVLDYLWQPAIPFALPRELLAERVLVYIVLPAIPILVLVIASVIGAWRRRWWGFLGLAFFIILAPTSSIMPIADLAFEHRMYLPLVCVICVVVMILNQLLGSVSAAFRNQAGLALALVIAAVFAWLTFERNYEYQSGVTIWETVVDRVPNNPRGWQNLGGHMDDLANRTEDPLARQQLKAVALQYLEKTLQLFPTYHQAHYGIANIQLERGNVERAITLYRHAIELHGTDPEYHYGLGMALLAAGDIAGAERAFDEAIRLKPTYAKALNNRGLIYVRQGRVDAALDSFRSAVEHGPEELEAYVNLAVTLNGQKRRGEAVEILRKGLTVEAIGINAERTRERIEEMLEKYNKTEPTDQPAGGS